MARSDIAAPRLGLSASLQGATAEQRAAYDAIATGPRGCVPTPFLAMLDAPGLTEAVQGVGLALRYAGALSDAEREIAILTTAGAVGAGYEWNFHAPIAAAAGVSSALISATRDGSAASGATQEEQLILTFCRTMATEANPATELVQQSVAAFGRAKTTELVAISGYYRMLALFLFVGGYDNSFQDPAG